MSDKKPDFDTLDLSDISNAKPVQPEVKKIPEKVQSKSNTFIDGKPIEEVTPEEMVDWIERKLGVKVNPNELNSATNRSIALERTILLLTNFNLVPPSVHSNQQQSII